jgi:hypothetical protein
MLKHIIFPQLLPKGGENYNTYAVDFKIMVLLIMMLSWPSETL